MIDERSGVYKFLVASSGDWFPRFKPQKLALGFISQDQHQRLLKD
jgi:hypothetical protein